ncbi:hypothetical protein SAMN05421776_11344 [Nocardia farcinica]|uniref:Uncharacterized protein n=1 Tax=Nocardia farcinica TaxID=37329 RepID=A0A0H5PA53_NOCFR|nr:MULTISPECIES: hypothetical protein [Nocardia]PFW99390.1 hypothetical protein CJ469_05310 [Nocardia farcinica]PFX06801.1 hypothetical protein CJ468_04201 [Nocardia farcinica]CRY84582.1 Uncharacterised protein [Nocardia farcinica]SIT32578.1 hypothetical protein SAMN05421776_11344 [Nocardia farcinica]
MASAVVRSDFVARAVDARLNGKGSPRPGEPDVHLRFVWADRVFDYRGCRSAVKNFLRKWSQGHNPAITAVELFDGFLPDHRMPCEELWLLP